ncbi:MAG: single-stranded-DNA-specific exonuclease RecJ, partial [Sporomusaceae bacterium]|nr:single-stranded-DNA-specific exonuclease RecJ [Sporomusaceae bacterium]
EAYDLASQIRIRLPNMKDQIGFYYAGLHTDWQTKVEKWFQQDSLSVVITTNACSEQCHIKDIRHVLLYSLPFNLRNLVQLCSLAGGDEKPSTVHLLFNDQDIEANHLVLKEIRPERITVGHVYLVLKKAQGVITEAGVAAQVRHNYQVTISQYSVRIAVQILEELNLVRYEIMGLNKTICLLPAPQEKLDIEQSVTFRQGLMEKAEFIEFATGIMAISVSQLLSQISE